MQAGAGQSRVRQEGTQSVAVALGNQSQGGHQNATSPPCRAALGERGEAQVAPSCPRLCPGLSSGAAVGRRVATLHFISWDCKKKKSKRNPHTLQRDSNGTFSPLRCFVCPAARLRAPRGCGGVQAAQPPPSTSRAAANRRPRASVPLSLTLVVPVFS